MAEKTKTVQTIKKYNISSPEQISKMALVVKEYVVKNNLYATIVGKNYVLVEGWMFAGGLLGLFPKVIKVECIGKDKWLAQVDIISRKDGSVASSGFALCSKEENKKSTFDEYAILSMAQTRAIGKAYRNLIGWVMKLAGYESTPAEEMKGKKEAITVEEEVVVEEGTEKVDELKSKLKGTTITDKLNDLKKRTGIKLDSFKITEKHANLLLATILNTEV
jgi:hypothetical protein